MDQKEDRERQRGGEDRGPDTKRERPVRRDANEAVPEFERGDDLDRGQEEGGRVQN
jgi:hypothetical protein